MQPICICSGEPRALLASPTDQALAQHKIIEGFVSHGALQWPEYIATEFGWFKEHGLEVDMLVVGAGAAQQVAAGALNIAYSGFPDFIRATNAGAPVKIVINAIGQPPYSVYSKPAIKRSPILRARSPASAASATSRSYTWKLFSLAAD